MGQKTNSNIFRIGYKKNEWNSKYVENSLEEINLYLHQDLEIKNFIVRFFKRYFLLVNYCKLLRTNNVLKIFISYYITLRSIFLINKINIRQRIIIQRKKKSYIKKKKKGYTKKKKKIKKIFKNRILFIKRLKKKNRNLLLKKNIDFFENLLESLTLYTKNKLNINIILQNINKGLSLRLKNKQSKAFRKTILKLRRFSRAIFFKEFINILTVTVLKKNSSKILADIIAFQFSVIKRHNYFLNFLKRSLTLIVKSKFSKVKGIKILIKGRLNGKPRSNYRIIQIGKISLQTIESVISHNQSTSFTPYGTFGIKVWICEK
nr:ribosomal protein S3 [Stephanopyxis turris]